MRLKDLASACAEFRVSSDFFWRLAMVNLAAPSRLGVPRTARYNTPVRFMSQPAKTRRQKLEEFVAAKPGDAFSRYGLAMECCELRRCGGRRRAFPQTPCVPSRLRRRLLPLRPVAGEACS